MRRLALLAAALVLGSGVGAVPASATASRPFLDVRVLAPVGAPGHPALAYVTPQREVYVGTYASPTECCAGRAKVFRYDAQGRRTGTWGIAGEDPAAVNGIQVSTRDRQGRLYLLDKLLARAVTLDPGSGQQRVYATFPDVPVCDGSGSQCSRSRLDNAPQANGAAWGPDGALYVTDFQQALIWRVPPHGGPGTPRTLWRSAPGDAPDGFAIAASGNAYVALLGPSGNAVVQLDPNGVETARTATADPAQQVPFDSPSSVAFLGQRLVVTNQATLTNDTSHMVLFDIWAGETGRPEFLPASAGPR